MALLVALVGMLVAVLAVSLASDEADAQDRGTRASGLNGPERVYGLTDNDDLLLFDGDRPKEIQSRKPIKGLADGDELVGIDFRPATLALYGLGRQGNVYLVNEVSGRARLVTTLKTSGGEPVELTGKRFGVDFNPTVDRLRIVSDADQNLRADVETGTTTVDANLSYSTLGAPNPVVTGVAYTNNKPSAFGGTTTIYYIDSGASSLNTSASPNSGVMTVVGNLGGPTQRLVGFDIVSRGSGNAAYASLKPPDKRSGFYSINLTSGAASLIGPIGGTPGNLIDDIAIPIGQI